MNIQGEKEYEAILIPHKITQMTETSVPEKYHLFLSRREHSRSQCLYQPVYIVCLQAPKYL